MRLGRIQNNYTAEGFDLVKKEKLSFIEICTNNQPEAEKLIATVPSIKAEIQRTGLPVSCVGRWNHDIQTGGKLDTDKLQVYFAELDAAVELGAKTFVCGCNYDPTVSLFKNYTNAISFFGMLCDRAEGKNIKIAIQNCDWNNFVVSDNNFDIVLGELPELCLKYDASHSYNRGEDYIRLLAKWGNRVAHIHIKGTTHANGFAVDDPPAGMDDIKWSSIFSVLYSVGYDGDLSIEPHSGAWLGEKGEAGIEFTRKFISQFIV